MKAFILAGGLGMRLRPLTLSVPKPMVPVCNRPLLLHLIRQLQRYCIDEIIFLLYYQPDPIVRFFADGRSLGFKARYVVAVDDYGTAGAVKNAVDLFDEPCLVVSGDLLADIDYGELMAFHRRHKGLMTMALTRVEDPRPYGNVEVDDQGRVVRFVEKPPLTETLGNQINAGIYVIEPALLHRVAPRRAVSFEHELFPSLVEERAGLYATEMAGYWRDLGMVDQYLAAHRDALLGDWPAWGSGDIEPAHIGAATVPECSLVGADSWVEPEAFLHLSVLGRRCHVAAGACLEGAVVWDDVRIASGARLRQCIVASGSLIEAGATVERMAVIGADCRVGRGCRIGAGVRLPPGTSVPAGREICAGNG